MNTDFAANTQSIPIPKLLEDILKRIHEGARDQIAKGNEVHPVVFAFGEAADDPGEVRVSTYDVAKLMNSSQNKEVIRMMMEEAIQMDDVSIVLLVTEAWLLKLPAENVTKDEALTIRPSEHPDKEEVVLINIMTKTAQFIATAKIYRDPVSLSEFEIVSLTGKSEGTLVRDEEDTPSIH